MVLVFRSFPLKKKQNTFFIRFFKRLPLIGKIKTHHAVSCRHCHHHYKIISLWTKKPGNVSSKQPPAEAVGSAKSPLTLEHPQLNGGLGKGLSLLWSGDLWELHKTILNSLTTREPSEFGFMRFALYCIWDFCFNFFASIFYIRLTLVGNDLLRTTI